MSAVNNRQCFLHHVSKSKIPTKCTHPWYCDRVKVTKCSYLWKIENYTSVETDVASPKFSGGASEAIKWQLVLFKEKQMIILKLVDSDKPSITFKFNASILNAAGEVVHTVGEYGKVHTASAKDAVIFLLCRENRDVLDVSKGLLLNDTLSLVCDINMLCDKIEDHNPWDAPELTEVKPNEFNLYDDMYKLLQSGKFSDVTFVTMDGKEEHAHKAILSLRSEVFASMFDHAMIENTSNQVTINDVENDVFREMLTYIYWNKSPNIDEMAFGLLEAADKYALKALKAMCELVLDRDLSVDNALPTLVLADRHCSELLRIRTIHFVKAHIESIMKNSDWDVMASDYPHLVDEINSYNGCI